MQPKQFHDLKTVREDIKILIYLIESGYQFNDGHKQDIIERLKRAQLTLNEFISQSRLELS